MLRLPSWFLAKRVIPGQPNIQPYAGTVPVDMWNIDMLSPVVNAPQQLGYVALSAPVVSTISNNATNVSNKYVPPGIVVGNNGAPTVHSSNAPIPYGQG